MTNVQWGTLTAFIAPAGTALAGAPWWVTFGAFVLLVLHRTLPRESLHLLLLWLQVLPRRDPEGGTLGKDGDET
ncbi:hypothetical protein [Dactylosporangium sp. NPDC005555]|uniref:hypothetical protein n=1 Tax=Dactylosporangium sp. NPDC005555 TaxID=3154889 RepID=UPI0033AA6B97